MKALGCLAILICASAWRSTTAFSIPVKSHLTPRFVSTKPLHTRSNSFVVHSSSPLMSDNSEETSLKKASLAYKISAGTISSVYLATCFSTISEASSLAGFNALSCTALLSCMVAPMPIMLSCFKSLLSASSVGWDRLQSATYRRLNLGLAASLLYSAVVVACTPSLKTLTFVAPVVYSAAAAVCITVWARSQPQVLSAEPLWRLFLRVFDSLVGSVFKTAVPISCTDNPESTDGRNKFALLSLSFLLLTVIPFTGTGFSIFPVDIGQSFANRYLSFMLLGTVVSYTLKDAAERARLKASTFRTLSRGLQGWAVIHAGSLLLMLALKMVSTIPTISLALCLYTLLPFEKLNPPVNG
uniref:Uncharacterized protein n=1 Tax=Fibrocapsa japonica TaxID=94617 RepID=A0A7S2V467_9STRA|mmetsp:Transcript_647/g.940  ORF Transcript_647/g.940 Transcript_647/m.940 type:complete len:356 (+) Transcript_647:59-1126(+)